MRPENRPTQLSGRALVMRPDENVMGHNIFSGPLAAAAQYLGSTQALARLLHVPEGTLLRWLAGRAMMPVRAFSKVLEIIQHHESRLPDEPARDQTAPPLTLTLNQSTACCANCGRSEFVHCTPALRLRYRALLACAACGTQAAYRDLLLELVTRHARHGTARTHGPVAERPATRLALSE